ncbi:class I SAM-dependent methyltransferase [Ideonella livida]|uniref:Class I SAM-dependent methyltransferase n=1 Tax=Ideonella livida TaxID=2707176 RepID=A0A7C9TL10_9BURK|nr:class I SAM-dependent methyltransferase [Ideonella livida]NDY93219.1 class I SAM-dependent methyltransferase [Ideonella livida]
MLRPALIPVLLRETLGPRHLVRQCEPDRVMEDPAQVRDYAHAGRIDGVMAASYLFHSAHLSATLAGARQVLDLACGPATQLAQVARLNPDTRFLGVDLSAPMLDVARAHARAQRLDNLDFEVADITDLRTVPTASQDAVVSTMALHHLPTSDHLAACLAEVARVLCPGGAVYLCDFGRLKSLASVRTVAWMNAVHQPRRFSQDFEDSLRAAFLKEDFAELSRRLLPTDVRLHSTFGVPLLVLLKTPYRGLSPRQLATLSQWRQGLAPAWRRDLDALRRFMALGGLRPDPFAAPGRGH